MQYHAKPVVDFLLAVGADLVVGTLRFETGISQPEVYLIAQILVVIMWSDWEVAAF